MSLLLAVLTISAPLTISGVPPLIPARVASIAAGQLRSKKNPTIGRPEAMTALLLGICMFYDSTPFIAVDVFNKRMLRYCAIATVTLLGLPSEIENRLVWAFTAWFFNKKGPFSGFKPIEPEEINQWIESNNFNSFLRFAIKYFEARDRSVTGPQFTNALKAEIDRRDREMQPEFDAMAERLRRRDAEDRIKFQAYLATRNPAK